MALNLNSIFLFIRTTPIKISTTTGEDELFQDSGLSISKFLSKFGKYTCINLEILENKVTESDVQVSRACKGYLSISWGDLVNKVTVMNGQVTWAWDGYLAIP